MRPAKFAKALQFRLEFDGAAVVFDDHLPRLLRGRSDIGCGTGEYAFLGLAASGKRSLELLWRQASDMRRARLGEQALHESQVGRIGIGGCASGRNEQRKDHAALFHQWP